METSLENMYADSRVHACTFSYMSCFMISSAVGRITNENCHKPLEGQVVLILFENLLNLEKWEKLMII